MSIQSFSNDILKGMKRYYTGFDNLKENLLYYTEKLPFGGLGGDFIVGFPGETNEMFTETLEEIKRLKFNYGHVFRYSPRPKTTAFELKNDISDSIKTQRSSILREYFTAARKEFIAPQLHSEKHTIVVENEKPIKGVTSNYIRVKIPESSAKKNSVVNIFLKEYDSVRNICIAELV